MKLLNVPNMKGIISAVVIAMIVLTGYGSAHADDADESKAVFFVG